MPSQAAAVTLTIGGNDIQDLGGIFLELLRGGPGEPPTARGPGYYVAPRLDGRPVRDRRTDLWTITLGGFVLGSGNDEDAQRSDYWDNRILLASWVPVTVTTELVAVLPNGATYSINVRGVDDRAVAYNEIVPSFALTSVELESADPDWELVGS